MKLLHVIPDSARDPRHEFLGSTKDVRCRTEYFAARSIEYDELYVPNRSDRALLAQLESLDLKQYDTVFVELSMYPASLQYLRRHHPHLRVYVRSINAELYHQLHLIVASMRYRNGGGTIANVKSWLWTMKHAPIRAKADYLSARRADCLLSITQWEVEHYWRRFLQADHVKCVPYFLPRQYSESAKGIAKKENHCVCLMSTTEGTLPFLQDAAGQFASLVRGLRKDCPDWSFSITGNAPQTIDLPARIQSTGFLQSPFQVLGVARAVALLSDYGFGFKTKILDAIESGCTVLVTRKLHERLPAEVQPCCLVVERNSVDSFKNALQRCAGLYPRSGSNELLRKRAFEALDEVLLGEAPALDLAERAAVKETMKCLS